MTDSQSALPSHTCLLCDKPAVVRVGDDALCEQHKGMRPALPDKSRTAEANYERARIGLKLGYAAQRLYDKGDSIGAQALEAFSVELHEEAKRGE